MRVATLAKRLLGVSRIFVRDVTCEPDGITIEVRPSWHGPRCGSCRRRAPGYDRQPARRWRHLAVGGVILWLRYAPRRVECRRCGVRAEAVSWATSLETRFTEAFEELVAYLARATDKTTVSTLLGIAWRSVGAIVERVVERHMDSKRLDGLVFIGIDEFSYRKRHHYLTVVVDHIERRIVWAAEGRSAETLARFFDELGPTRTRNLECITLDMSAGYLKTIRDRAPRARVIFDRFHVQRLAQEAVDAVRRAEVRQSRGTEEAKVLKRTRFILLKNPWNLTNLEGEKLAELQRTNRPIYRAYMLKEGLAGILDGLDVDVARVKLREWIGWATRSHLEPFKKLARTINDHFEGILAYIPLRLNNGRTEGMNGKIRTITRRSYGFHSASNLIALIFLCCSGISLLPVLKFPTKEAMTSAS